MLPTKQARSNLNKVTNMKAKLQLCKQPHEYVQGMSVETVSHASATDTKDFSVKFVSLQTTYVLIEVDPYITT